MDRVDGKKTPDIMYCFIHLLLIFATVRHLAYAGSLLPRRHRLITIQLLLESNSPSRQVQFFHLE